MQRSGYSEKDVRSTTFRNERHVWETDSAKKLQKTAQVFSFDSTQKDLCDSLRKFKR